MVAKTAGVYWRRDESMAKRKHRQERCHFSGVAKIVSEWRPGHGGTGSRLDRNDIDLGAVNLVGDKRKGQTGKVTAAANAADDGIHFFHTGKGQLFFGFEADDRLVQ